MGWLPGSWWRWLQRQGWIRANAALRRWAGAYTQQLCLLTDELLQAVQRGTTGPTEDGLSGSSEAIDLRWGSPRPVSLWPGNGPNCGQNPWSCITGWAELQQAIVTRWWRASGKEPGTVLITPGATAAWTLFADACLNAGDSVVLFDPCSPLFGWGVRQRGARIHWIPTWIEDGWCRFPRPVLERAMRRAKAVVLAEPVNPTGARLHAEDRGLIAWLAAAHKVLLYVDVTFDAFQAAEKPLPWGTIKGLENHLVAAGSLNWQGRWGGWRLGWITGPALVMRAVALLQQWRSALVPLACQQWANHYLLETIDEEQTLVHRRLEQQRQHAMDVLRTLGLESGDTGQGCFLWVSTASTGLNGRDWAHLLAQHHHVRVLPGELCGPSGRSMVRLCLLQPPALWQEALRRLAAFGATWKNSPTTCTTAPLDLSWRPADQRGSSTSLPQPRDAPSPQISSIS
ncbi:MAG: pyridoxal phosphate-dependent aminotransferase [Gemmataceae bacterium]|nr:pyridoxal phosphate-dependent aminotransferase [Gemmataceae bacterium]